jgi:hypothetical protein
MEFWFFHFLAFSAIFYVDFIGFLFIFMGKADLLRRA